MAFDWIESHRGLRDHPKTVMLAASWADRKTCVIGHLHELWWWSLEYAPDGIIRPAFYPLVVQACEWHGKPEKFWSGLLESGFLEFVVGVEGYIVHDWDEYAARRLARLDKDAARKRAVRDKRTGQTPDITPDNTPDNRPMSGGASAGQPPDRTPDTSCARAHQPTNRQDVKGSEEPITSSPTYPLPPPDKSADAQGPEGHASAQLQPDDPVPLHEGAAGICPLCRQPYLGAYLDHTAERHRVRSRADDLTRKPRPDVEAPPLEMLAQFDAMHERLESLPQNGSA